MKRRIFGVVVACSVFVSSLCDAFAAQPSRIRISVKGMVCSFCAQGIKKTLSRREGVKSVDVDLDKKLVTVLMNGEKEFPDSEIRETIVDSGFEVVSIERSSVDQSPELK